MVITTYISSSDYDEKVFENGLNIQMSKAFSDEIVEIQLQDDGGKVFSLLHVEFSELKKAILKLED